MPTVVGVKLRFAGKVLYFDPAGMSPAEGEHVIVSTERGQEFGEVVFGPKEVTAEEIPSALKPVLRIAGADDIEKVESARARESDEIKTFRRLVAKHKLAMKPIGVEHLFDGSKMVLYFAAEERVDFRDLVRDLASEFHTRIDMRQVGVRDEARMIGGLGHCGEHLCCSRFQSDFQPVSIRMAKEQDLPLNPLKISGLCGRLMCCLRYEFDAYKDFKSRAPKCGSPVETPMGDAKVVALNVPREVVTIKVLEGGKQMSVPLAALDCSAGKGCPCVLKADALPEPEVSPTEFGGSAPRAARRPEKPTEPREDRQPKPRRSRGRGGSGGGQPEQGKKAESAPPASETKAAPSSGRKRRRRRPRLDGSGGGQESKPT
jgi:cell fate regulator YaaT (PSP1 superfamily)